MENLFFEEEEEEKKERRKITFQELLRRNYEETFIKSVERTANRFFKKEGISRIEIVPALNTIMDIKIYNNEGKEIEDKDVEKKIRKLYKLKKEALDKNSDRYFKERKSTNQKENLIRRSLGEENERL